VTCSLVHVHTVSTHGESDPRVLNRSPTGKRYVASRSPWLIRLCGFALGQAVRAVAEPSLPQGWALSTRPSSEVTFTGPDAGFVILVAWNTQPKPDALADWRNQAALKARSDPTYQQIAIRRVPYRGWNAADWEFTNMDKGQLTHVLDRGFIVTPGSLGYAIDLSGPDAGWSPVRARLWAHLVRTFSPAG